MKASIVDLRYRSKDILRAVEAREPVALYFHGKLKAMIVPAERQRKMRASEHEFFGMRQRDRRSVARVMRELRRPRHDDL